MNPNDMKGRLAPVIALLVLVTLAVFWPVLQNRFVNFDDADYVTANPVVHQGFSSVGVKWAFTTGHSSNWHPLTWLSHMLDCQWYGLNPWGHHLTSLLLHTGNAVLLLLLLHSLTGSLGRSLWVAALFALHPLRVESVAWVAERKDVLSAFFGLLCLLAYVRHTRWSILHSPSSILVSWRSPWFWLTFLLLAGGLLSKPMLVTWPCVMLLLDFWPLRRIELANLNSQISTLRKLLVEKLPFFALVIASSVVTYLVQKTGGAVESLGRLSLEVRLENAVVAYARYLGKALWPAELSVVYPHPGSWPGWVIAGAALVVLAISAGAIKLRNRQPQLLVGWLWYLGTLVPVIGLVQVGSQSIADRYTYLPMIGVGIAFVWTVAALVEARKAWKQIGLGVAVAGLVALSVVTRNQIGYWRDAQSLFTHALALDGKNFIACNYLGTALAQAGRTTEATGYYERAVQLKPDYADAYNNWGYTLAQLGRFAEAVPKYEMALQLKPRHPRATPNLGSALLAVGEYARAAACYRTALELKPGDVDLQFNLASALLPAGEIREAAALFRLVVARQPDDMEALGKLAVCLTSLGQFSEAADCMSKVATRQNTPQAYFNLALVLRYANQDRDAIQQLRKAIELDANWPEARNELAWLLATHPEAALRNGAEAVQLAERACELTGHKEARFLGTLDACYAEAGRFDEAIATAHQAQALAQAAGQTPLVQAADERLRLYKEHQPYRQVLQPVKP